MLLKDAFDGLVLSEQDKLETDMSKYSLYMQRLRKLKKGEQDRKRFSLFKASPYKCSPCITATTGTVGAANPCHWENRAFSVAEVKRIMSVPDDYVLTGTYKQKVERLGRMVAPLMMKAVAKNLQEIGVINGNT